MSVKVSEKIRLTELDLVSQGFEIVATLELDRSVKLFEAARHDKSETVVQGVQNTFWPNRSLSVRTS